MQQRFPIRPQKPQGHCPLSDDDASTVTAKVSGRSGGVADRGRKPADWPAPGQLRTGEDCRCRSAGKPPRRSERHSIGPQTPGTDRSRIGDPGTLSTNLLPHRPPLEPTLTSP